VSQHITINGRTYASVNEMPPEVRRQYESAMQMLAKGRGGLAGDVAGSDVNISTQGSDPAHHKTVTKMTASRIVINGKEYSQWEDVPPEARAAFQSAGIGADAQNIGNKESLRSQIRYQANIGNTQVSLDPSWNVTMGLGIFIVLLCVAVLGGVLIGWRIAH
jgi:hypothetical protein